MGGEGSADGLSAGTKDMRTQRYCAMKKKKKNSLKEQTLTVKTFLVIFFIWNSCGKSHSLCLVFSLFKNRKQQGFSALAHLLVHNSK